MYLKCWTRIIQTSAAFSLNAPVTALWQNTEDEWALQMARLEMRRNLIKQYWGEGGEEVVTQMEGNEVRVKDKDKEKEMCQRYVK